MGVSISSIQSIVKGEWIANSIGTSGKDTPIRHLLIDSRKINSAEDSVFFAIKGERHDGHRYINELYKNGIRNFIVSDNPKGIQRYPHPNFIKVDDTLVAMQALCAHHRSQFDIPVIGITGSNGKTIVKEWLYQLLQNENNIVRSPKSYNSQVGVPLSVWQMNSEHTLAIFEAGISKPHEMEKLQPIIAPTIGIFTNIGPSHSENFSGNEEKVKEKLKLFTGVKALIYCKDYPDIEQKIRENDRFKDTTLFSWSAKTKADLQVGKIDKSNFSTEIQGVFHNNFITINIPFIDDASIENAIHCWATMLHLGYENNSISQRMKELIPIAMRLELKEGINHCSIINDSYNSDLGSLKIALDFLNQQNQHYKKTLILSDILESGKDEQILYMEVASLIAQKGVTRLIGIGEAITNQADLFTIEKDFYLSTEDFIRNFSQQAFRNEVVLLKGARVFEFEKISWLLQQKAHETVLEINLDALAHNYNYYKAKLKPHTKIMAMVKAFSYGSGSFEIANLLQFNRVDYLAVAYADEGIELRKAGITVPIMVMSPEEQSFDTMIQYQLEPEIYSFRIFHLFAAAIERNKTGDDSPFPVHLKLDTGMRRLGFEKESLNELIVRINNNRSLKIKSIFSHLAASDEAVHDSFTRQQVDQFLEMSKTITAHLQYPVLLHILNSSGISRFPEAQLDMVRLGIGLYGIGTDEEEQKKLQNVSTLKSTISQIKTAKAGETVGYSRKGKVTKDTQVATIPIGYADGLSRKLSNGAGKILVNGKLAPILGNVCMDMVMIDISGIQANEGDEVIIFGENPSIIDMAKTLDTIPYEVLTLISRRVKRIYYQE